jgi:hypothetical protein
MSINILKNDQHKMPLDVANAVDSLIDVVANGISDYNEFSMTPLQDIETRQTTCWSVQHLTQLAWLPSITIYKNKSDAMRKLIDIVVVQIENCIGNKPGVIGDVIAISPALRYDIRYESKWLDAAAEMGSTWGDSYIELIKHKIE